MVPRMITPSKFSAPKPTTNAACDTLALLHCGTPIVRELQSIGKKFQLFTSKRKCT